MELSFYLQSPFKIEFQLLSVFLHLLLQDLVVRLSLLQLLNFFKLGSYLNVDFILGLLGPRKPVFIFQLVQGLSVQLLVDLVLDLGCKD